VFVEITAQIPAVGADATETRLRFTGESWTAIAAALRERTSSRRAAAGDSGGPLARPGRPGRSLAGAGHSGPLEEQMLGWWHSHPVREWCKACPDDRQRQCSVRKGFFSEHDRALHRAVFSTAWHAGLLVNDTLDGPTFTLFGWRRGELVPRGFHATGITSCLALTTSLDSVTEACTNHE
jgi:hypothetical protein